MGKQNSNFQGSLDGLCGLYAIANAFSKVGKDLEDVFETAARALKKSRWPDVMFKGTTIRDMQVMLKQCSVRHGGLKASYPFLRADSTPQTNKDYWERFFELTSSEQVVCCIAGRLEPSLHWIVIQPDQNRVSFTDSDPNDSFFRKNVTTIHAGYRKKSDSHWKFYRTELIVLSKV